VRSQSMGLQDLHFPHQLSISFLAFFLKIHKLLVSPLPSQLRGGVSHDTVTTKRSILPPPSSSYHVPLHACVDAFATVSVSWLRSTCLLCVA
jgi:hypothetical protein